MNKDTIRPTLAMQILTFVVLFAILFGGIGYRLYFYLKSNSIAATDK